MKKPPSVVAPGMGLPYNPAEWRKKKARMIAQYEAAQAAKEKNDG